MTWIATVLLAILGVEPAEQAEACAVENEQPAWYCGLTEQLPPSNTPRVEGRTSKVAPSSPQISNGF